MLDDFFTRAILAPGRRATSQAAGCFRVWAQAAYFAYAGPMAALLVVALPSSNQHHVAVFRLGLS